MTRDKVLLELRRRGVRAKRAYRLSLLALLLASIAITVEFVRFFT